MLQMAYRAGQAGTPMGPMPEPEEVPVETAGPDSAISSEDLEDEDYDKTQFQPELPIQHGTKTIY